MPLDPQPHPWHDRRHHAPEGGFRNPDPTARAASLSDAAWWMAGRLLGSKDNAPPPVHPLDPDRLRTPPDGLRITWLGHASLLLQWPGLTVLTDPMLSRRASPFALAGPARLPAQPGAVADLPPIDVVLLSHDHYDHLDRATVRALHARFDPLFLVPLGVDAHLRRWGIDRTVALDWHHVVACDGWRFHATPAQHFSGRGLFDRNATLWAGWFVEPPGTTAPSLFFAGDTAYATHFGTLCTRLGAPDVACLPIGAYRPRRLMQPVHMNPGEAVRAALDLAARHVIPIHWGTFDLADEPVQEPATRLRDRAAHHDVADRIHLLDIGAAHTLASAPRQPSEL